MGWLSSRAPDWAKFRRLPGYQRLILIRAALVLPAVALLIRVAGFQRATKWLAKVAPLRTGTSLVPGRASAVDTSRMVAAAAGGLRAVCLSKAVTLWLLLRRQGVDSEVRMGVRKGPTGVEAHAWVVSDGVPLDDTAEVGNLFVGIFPPFPPS